MVELVKFVRTDFNDIKQHGRKPAKRSTGRIVRIKIKIGPWVFLYDILNIIFGG